MEMMRFGNIFRERRVLVTGHTGFKGSWLSLWLYELGAQVTGFALAPNTSPSHFELLGLQELVRHVEGDIRDRDAVNHAFETAAPEIVFHLAAQPLVRDSYDDPRGTFDTNIGGTVNVLEAIRSSSTVKAAVLVTSDKCYENREWLWGYRENDPLGGHDPYSASKGAAEIVCSSYQRSFFNKNGRGPQLGCATARAGNVIGGGDWAKDRLIPDCVRALSDDKPILVRNPHATRPWQHVLEPLSGYLFLAQRLFEDPERYAGAWNFGPLADEGMTVAELAERFITTWGSGEIVTSEAESSAPHEASILRLSIDKAASVLNWRPVLSSSSAIDWTVAWYRRWAKDPSHMRKHSLRDIREYEQRTKRCHASWVE